MKILNGKELAGYIKERQAHEASRLRAKLGRKPKLVIIYDNDSPVIKKYMQLKQCYGEDIGVEVEQRKGELKEEIVAAGEAEDVDGIIVQLPLAQPEMTDEALSLIPSRKDVDGLRSGMTKSRDESKDDAINGNATIGTSSFDSATATAIHWLLNGYGIELQDKKIAVVGRGRLVGAPLIRMWKVSGYDVTEFGRDGDLNQLPKFDIIVTATGVPHLVKTEMVASGTVVVDAGTASENGVLVGDVDESVRERDDLGGITPKIGGVGPLTVSALFENVLKAANNS